MLKNAGKSLFVICMLIAGWFALSRAGVWSEYVLPGPERVWAALIKMLSTGELARHTLASLKRVALGFSISFLLGFLLGTVSSLFPKADPWYAAITEMLRHVPPMSLIPLLILWFGIGETPKTIIIVLTSFFPIYMNTVSGIRACDKRLIEVGRSLGFSKVKQFFRISLPAAMPSVLVGARVALGYSWRAIVGAEMVAAFSGLGYLILDSQAMSRSDKVIAGILVIGCVGLITDKLFGAVIKLLGRRVAG